MIYNRLWRIKGKATGPDQLSNEILRAGGDQMCAMLHELLVKAVCAGREPLQWKAGRAVPLYKKGAISNPDNYRSIFLFDSIAKLHHNLLRDRLYATYEKVASKACFGGRKGCGTDMGHYMLQSLLSLSEYAAVSAAFVFLDLHAAFYSVIRQGLFGQPLHDEYLCMFLARQGISPQELDEWEKQAQLDYALQGQSQLVQNWAQDAFKNAHFSMKGLKSLALTSRGTRPGDPIGDICFNIIMQKVLAEVRQRVSNWGCADLLEQPVQEVLGQDLPGFLDVSFFDDVAFGILHASHERLIAAAAVVLSALCDSARTRGLQVNFQAEKIELMLVLKGRGARKKKQELWMQADGTHPILLEHRVEHVRLVRSYKHLGSHLQCDAKPSKDVQFRIASARKAWGPMIRSLWTQKQVA